MGSTAISCQIHTNMTLNRRSPSNWQSLANAILVVTPHRGRSGTGRSASAESLTLPRAAPPHQDRHRRFFAALTPDQVRENDGSLYLHRHHKVGRPGYRRKRRCQIIAGVLCSSIRMRAVHTQILCAWDILRLEFQRRPAISSRLQMTQAASFVRALWEKTHAGHPLDRPHPRSARR